MDAPQSRSLTVELLAVSPAVELDSRTLEELERDHIAHVLKRTRGLIEGPGGAAALLGRTRTPCEAG